MTRTEFQELAEVRLKEAEVLLAAGLWDGAYYLAGYAVECGLKACIAKKIRAEEFPDKEISSKFFVHDLTKLMVLADLKTVFEADITTDPLLEANWKVVVSWDEAKRYKRILEGDARDMISALSFVPNGVLLWIKRYW